MDRRTFLKTAGMGGVAFIAGCDAHPERHLYTLVKSADDRVTGRETWYASTCRECPAGCGVLAKNREGRVIKLEGNPLHPVNHGKLCARGQAALQRLYHPDRIASPLLKTNGQWQPVALPEALSLIRKKLAEASAKGNDRVALVSQMTGETMRSLLTGLLAAYGSGKMLVYEPLAYESLKYAHAQVFGKAMLPGFHLDRADMILGFGADFVETWLSPVAYAGKFKAMHALQAPKGFAKKGTYCHVSAFQSLTAANADRWLACRPGSEAVVAMGVLRRLLARGLGRHLPAAVRSALVDVAAAYTPESVTRLSDVPAAAMTALADRLQAAEHPLVLPTSALGSGEGAVAADLATVWLNVVLDPALAGYDFDYRHSVEIAQGRKAANVFWQQMATNPVDLLLLNEVNPLYDMPKSAAVASALQHKAVFSVVFCDVMTETAAAADLIIPVQHPLLDWDSYESLPGMLSMLQPVMGPIGEAPRSGDAFLQLWPEDRRPAASYQAYVFDRLRREKIIDGEGDWLRLLQKGGHFDDKPSSAGPPVIQSRGVTALAQALDSAVGDSHRDLIVQVVPSLRFFDGRSTGQPWLMEIPDPMTQIAWQAPALVHPDVMTAKGWAPGQTVEIVTAHGSLRVPVFGHQHQHPGVIALAMGQGHSHLGRYARGQGADPLNLLSGEVDPESGAPGYAAAVVGAAAMGGLRSLALSSGSRDQLERKIALSVPLAAAGAPSAEKPGLAMDDFPFTAPLPEGYDAHRDIYPAHSHEGYRWGMVVDLDRCIGCSACVAACYAENNVGMVGEDQMVKGREMAWLRIESYHDQLDPERQIFLPMLCQHCDNAPCESVCPVYAPHHSKEGLNNQIYNRCIGTRFCAQNCPYKVRRFNWLAWQWPEPLNLQLNPDVTVRSKGVMEKCSFCVQRIKEGHNIAKNENRAIRDGEVVPACAQTCPTDAIVFGDLMNPDSRVRQLMADPRAYQVMGYLNTKPAVIYLKKVLNAV